MKTTRIFSLMFVSALCGTLLCVPTTFAQYTPEKGSAERKAITDTLRVPVEKKLKQSVVFKIDHLKVEGDWAFLLGSPRKPSGERLAYSKTVYADAETAGMFDDNISALLHRVRGRWQVVRYVIGATDVPYVDWDKQYRAPSGIFPGP